MSCAPAWRTKAGTDTAGSTDFKLPERHQNQVVTRDMLFDAAWGYDYLPNSRTLDQHISRLRKVIERDANHPQLIRTVHGLGYRYQVS